MYASFERFELKLTKDQTLTGSHPGPCDDDIEALLKIPAIKKQLDKIESAKIRDELKEYGAWNDQELSDDGQNRARILWIACGNIRDELNNKGRS